MIIGYHLIFTAYGWWLPNDPRGSTSHEIRNDIIAQLGELHRSRKRVQPNSAELREFYDRARSKLKHELRTFGTNERRTIACGFARTIQRCRYTCYACAIMPDHVHILIRKHRDKAEQMIARFQDDSRSALIESGAYLHDHPVWGGPGWKVFLETAEDMMRTTRYIERNPLPYGMPPQQHAFVNAYDGWNLSKAAR